LSEQVISNRPGHQPGTEYQRIHFYPFTLEFNLPKMGTKDIISTQYGNGKSSAVKNKFS
jgi:hypothetical protein